MSSRAVVALLLVAGSVRVAGAQESGARLVNNEQDAELLVIVGPVDIPAGVVEVTEAQQGMEDHSAHGAVFPPVATLEIPVSAYLHGFSYEVVDGDGRKLPGAIVHHLNLINPDYKELFLPISQRMLAVGKETGSQSMPWLLLGYPVASGTRMVVTAMLHNPTGEPFTGVEVHVRLRYVKAGRPWPLFSVYPFQLDVAFPAGNKSFDLPPGRSAFSYEGSPAMAGRIMAIGGHLHEYATSLRFEDITENKVIWEGLPIYDEDGEQLVGVTLGRLYRTLGAKISPDHVYRVTVSYNNPTADTLQDGGMGVVGGVFMPSAGGMWPRADTSNYLYSLDRMHYMREVRGRYEEIVGMTSGARPESEAHEHRD